jgi:hypothetical protein
VCVCGGGGVREMTNRTKLTLKIPATMLASPLESPSFTWDPAYPSKRPAMVADSGCQRVKRRLTT